ncbi:hypothetical protein TRP66_22795 [Pseudomonas sp. JDS28PS106]|uniref:dermonecrotic toxin domain-containing protein n=1 Tax=Pseudomonas sp. JDS28PS106 TaxID=2497235 RepID=UPI002FD2A58A
MSATAVPYFHDEALRRRYAKDIDEAVDASRITIAVAEWLRALVESEQTTEIMPRVDRLLIGGRTPVSAELAGALIISEVARPAGPIYLSTIMFGIKEYATRDALLAALQQQFPEAGSGGQEIDLEHVKDDPFTRRMELILEQQAAHLDRLASTLHNLPTLQKAVGEALQGEVDKFSAPSVDVFTHLVQVVNRRRSEDNASVAVVLKAQTLAETAYQLYMGQQLEDGLNWQFLDGQGAVLDKDQSGLYRQALSDASDQVSLAYRKLLTAYWACAWAGAQSMQQAGADALADAFRQNLLKIHAGNELDLPMYRRFRQLLPQPGAQQEVVGLTVESISVSVEGRPAIKLSGLMLLECPGLSSAGLYLFSSAYGFVHVRDRNTLTEYLTDTPTQRVLLAHADVVEHDILISQNGILELQYQKVAAPVFATLMADVIELQQRNLNHVLALPKVGYDQAPVRIDDALDIRQLLDCRLLDLGGSWRWTTRRADFHGIWDSVEEATSQHGDDMRLLFETWADQVDRLETQVNQVADLHQEADVAIGEALNRYLAVLAEPGLDARSLWVGRGEGASRRCLPSYILEAITGAVDLAMPADWIVQRESAGNYLQVDVLPLDLLMQIVKRVVKEFPTRYAERLRNFYKTPLRRGNAQISPAAINGRVREQALRLEILIQRRLKKVDADALDMIEQVLDRPVDVLQKTLGQGRVQRSAVALSFGAQEVVALHNALILTQCDTPDRLVMWAAGMGIGDFASLSALEAELTARLTETGGGKALYDLMPDPDRGRLEDYLASTTAPEIRVVLTDIEGNLIDALQTTDTERQVVNALDACQDAAAWRLTSNDFINMLYICERDEVNRRMLSELRNAIREIVSLTIVPEWIRDASWIDQDKLMEAMQRFYITCALNEGFLFDIPMLQHYARQRVRDQLNIDLPNRELDPDLINITLTSYVMAPVATGSVPQALPAATRSATETLSDFAANRFYAAQEGILSVRMADGSPPDPKLTPVYIRELVNKLNVAQDYVALLSKAFGKDSPDYGKRQKLFARQLPALEMLRALTLRLQGGLSEDARRLIGSILEMPDGLARLKVKGQYATISPLRLRPDDSSPDTAIVLGTYVIAPQDQNTGPWILYSLIGDFVFKEYPDKAALLQDIRTSSTLQAYLLERIDEAQRKIYANGGFQEPHLPFSTESSFDVPLFRPKPVTMEITAYEGNALELLFRDMLSCYLWSVRKIVVTNEQEQRRSSRYLFGLGAEQTLAFLPGRLGALVGVWQSRDLFKASATSAGEREWGKAFSEFTAAVGTLIATRHESGQTAATRIDEAGDAVKEDATALESTRDPEATTGSASSAAYLDFSWRNSEPTPELRSRLRAFEAHDVALNTLRKNELTSTYADSEGRAYVAISGSVYQIARQQDHWFIVIDDRWGPAVVLGENQRWQLTFGGLKGGGVSGSRLRGTAVDREVDDMLMVEARGMREIRRKSTGWAAAIESGHEQARVYLENCIDNLTPRPSTGTVHPTTQRVVDEYFSQHRPDTTLYRSIRRAVVKLYESLVHPSLSPQNSDRFVVGINRQWHESITAFTFRHDPQERFFLTEKFFRVPVHRLKTQVVRAGTFSAASHHYATILLHELTHLVLHTDDIVYVDAERPYIDLLDDSSAYRLTQKNEIMEQQQRTLSYNTDRSRLFRRAEEGSWRDLSRSDGDAKQTILRVTGAKTLEQARDVFYADQNKRAELMMSNADSVALLITLLGRERFNPRR